MDTSYTPPVPSQPTSTLSGRKVIDAVDEYVDMEKRKKNLIIVMIARGQTDSIRHTRERLFIYPRMHATVLQHP